MKLILLILIVISFSLLFSDELPVSVDLNRFLDDNSNTIFDLNYQIPYSSLQFERTDSGFTANLKGEYMLTMDGEIVDKGDFANKLIFPNQEMTRSGKLFRDKISVTLPSSVYTMQMSFTDILSTSNTSWSKELIILKKDSFLSDIEFSSGIVIDTTGYLEKLQRDDMLFFIDCKHIYTKGEVDSLYLYYELGNVQFPVGILHDNINILKVSFNP